MAETAAEEAADVTEAVKKEPETLEEKIAFIFKEKIGKELSECTDKEVMEGLLIFVRGEMEGRKPITGKKKLYYISAEFLIGKLLSNNLINLGLYDEVRELLKANGKDLAAVEECEPEPSLGNGGLGRLAACFLDSIATLSLPGDGIGLNYHFGLFEQKFIDYKQREFKNEWITPESWLVKREGTYSVPFRRMTVNGSLYDIDVPGYGVEGVNRLHLFDVDSVDETLVGEEGIDFDKDDIARNLTLFLYPDDSDRAGRLLRIYQQYFMTSCGAQFILKEAEEAGYDLRKLDEHAAIQINDTHPSMVIPELIRLLGIRGLTMDEAISVVERTCAYTNHTILAEALEKWPMDYMEEVVPHQLPIIRELDNRIRKQYEDGSLYIIDGENRVHMAHMDIHYGHSVNGVAALHTDILKNTQLKKFYAIYPDKFNNKTNGITFRRWLLYANPLLTKEIESLIGSGFRKDAEELLKLKDFADDAQVLARINEIKHQNKIAASNYLKETQGIEIDTDSLFDVQMKRLHAYKRQQMNALFAIHEYLRIKEGKLPKKPVTMLFGAKAAPAYELAKDIIHLLLCLQELTTKDPKVAPYFKVVFLENYNVSKAEKFIPAANLSEQISLASQEASGTGNMKFMLNGALTIGTLDGANVEIRDLVGEENIYIFGKKPQDVLDLYATGGYHAKEYYDKDETIAELVDFILGKELLAIGDETSLKRLHDDLIGKDWFMTLLDTAEYIRCKDGVYDDYATKKDEWDRKVLLNIAGARFFSSDRTIAEYNRDIWHLS
ncbi:MAG: glycogen/starch/alpha-glucan phosphorylase [Lachnospiraceae bacterium]|nr:glycogen/starch/alpha-glucan phosphorylase [Lachnospiraceae bacterium]